MTNSAPAEAFPPGDFIREEMEARGWRQVDLVEILGNLCDNACKWAKARVTVRAGRRNGRLAVAIEDDGPGIAPDERAVAMTRGQRLDERVPGSGLGLDIVREIVALYRGHLALGDSPLGGLKVELDLPAA